jgi:hypothetical protein
MRFTVADEILFAIDGLPMEQDDVALVAAKLTCNPFGTPFDMAVAVTVSELLDTITELGNEPRLMVWSFLSTAGGDGGLWRGAGLAGSGTTVVEIV